MALLLEGSKVNQAIYSDITARIDKLSANGIIPALAILRVGESIDQISYEKSAEKRCVSAGISVNKVILRQDAGEEEIIRNIRMLNNDEKVHGVLVLRPMPPNVSDNNVRAALLPSKDVDGITDVSLAGVLSDTYAGFYPCTPQACMEILDYYQIDCTGKHAVVLGRSLVVGKPVALMLTARNATVTLCHSKTRDIAAITGNADIIIAATGRPESLTSEYFSAGQTVIDVGISWCEEKGKICGDVKFDEVEPIVAAVSPVPGGVGTVTSAVLALHVVKAAEKISGIGVSDK